MRTRISSLALVGALGAWAASAQSAGNLETLPNPPAPSLTQIEMEARRSARRPGDRPRTMTASERKRIEALRAPNAEDVQKHSEFLKQENTGIIRLFPDADCVQKNLVRVGGDCENHVPGGSGMSLRGKSSNHDIRFSRGELIADGFFSVAIIVDLGSVELESVHLNSKGIDFLSGYEPARELPDALRDLLFIKAGESRPPFRYSDRAAAAIGNTFAARIVAFDADNIGIKRFGRDRGGVADWATRAKFAALRYDNRGDILAAFRIIRQDDDGSITILWKQLAERKAPKLRFDDHQALKDFK